MLHPRAGLPRPASKAADKGWRQQWELRGAAAQQQQLQRPEQGAPPYALPPPNGAATLDSYAHRSNSGPQVPPCTLTQRLPPFTLP